MKADTKLHSTAQPPATANTPRILGRRCERGELRGWLHRALLVEGATRAPEIEIR